MFGLVAPRVLVDFLQNYKSKRKRKLQLIVLKFQLISQIVINFQRHRDSAVSERKEKTIRVGEIGRGHWGWWKSLQD